MEGEQLCCLYSEKGKAKQGPVMKELGLGDDALDDDLAIQFVLHYKVMEIVIRRYIQFGRISVSITVTV